ncbi:MutS protein msh4 [Coemansia sp. RSA 552]|nr:MutS protein msh4 [Coemansia sp. RSA 552]
MSCSYTIDLTQLSSDPSSDVEVIGFAPPPFKRVKTEVDAQSTHDTSIDAVTSAYSEVLGNPNSLMVLTEGRGHASEIAYCLFSLDTSQCMLSQFSDSASYSRTIYAIVTLQPQVVLVPKAMANGKSKAMLNIRRYLPWLTVVPLERKRFSDADGVQVLQTIAVPGQALQLLRVLHTKQYAYAALNAMIYHIEHDMDMSIASGSINVTYKQMEGSMQIDPGAWRDLALAECNDSRKPKDDEGASTRDQSLFSAINHTQTKMGGRLLRANILQPSTDLSTIYTRQNAVLEILDNEELFFLLSAQLTDFPDLDAVITSLVRQPTAVATSRQASQAINNVLQVKHILQKTKELAGGVTVDLQSTLLDSALGVLTDARIDELLEHIHSVVREDVTMEKSAHLSRSQRCHAVKDGVDSFLDVSRAIFDKVTEEVVELVSQYSDEIQVAIRAVYKPSAGYTMTARRDALGDTIPEEFVNVVVKKAVIKLNNRLSSVVTEINLLTEKAIQDVTEVIRDNIVILYRISEAVALLDMVVSFAHHCTLHECVVPEFSDSIRIVQGRHPILDVSGHEVVANDVMTVGTTFTIVSGPNMGGKSTYLRQIIYTVIMAQIGSLVPAQSATLKVFDKLFVRMNNNDNLTAGESTFLREMHDISYILQNYDRHSLLLIDELGRSTTVLEGKALCRAICEELLDTRATVFVTTHFLDLPDILGAHQNCTQVVLSATAEDGQAAQRFKAALGVQNDVMYGIALAEKMGFPSDVIEIAKEVAKEAPGTNMVADMV